MRRPLLYPLIAMIGGILIGDRTFLPAVCLLTAFAAVLLLLLPAVRSQSCRAAFALILLFMCLVGMFNIQRQAYKAADHRHIVHLAGQGELTVEGVVVKIEPLSATYHGAVVSCRRTLRNNLYTPVTGNIRLTFPADMNFHYGDFIRFHTQVRKIESFNNPGCFDYGRHLRRKGIYVSGYVSGRAGIVLIRQGAANPFVRKLENHRLSLTKLIYANASSPQREIIEAMILGNKKSIPADVRDSFAKTGTAHILAISGLHVGMVAASCFFLFLLFMKTSEYLMLRFNVIKLATAASFIPVAAYALIAGMGTPVLRSALMALAFFTALLIGRQKDLYQTLFLAALLILTAMPEAVFEISFQLSFAAVFALIHIVPKFSNVQIPFLSGTPGPVKSLVRRTYLLFVVSAAATAGTLPLIAFYFNRISVVTLAANLIAVPLMSMLVLIPALCAVPIAFFWPAAAGFFIKTAAFFTEISVSIINRLAAPSFASFAIFKPTIVEIIIFYILVFALAEIFTPAGKKAPDGLTARHLRVVKAIVLICALFFIIDAAYWIAKDRFSRQLTITAIDVGQGSSTLVRMPGGVNMLIDGGGFHDSSFDMGKSVIAPVLYAERIGKIDIVVLTHPHPDHLQGLIYIVNNFHVREVWYNGIKTDDDLFRLFEKAISDHGIKPRVLSAGDAPVIISGVTFECLWPGPLPAKAGQYLSHNEVNDTSLVFKIVFGKASFLVTGDISRIVETALIDRGHNLKADLLFVPHHGSVHSSSENFIKAVSPRYALISAGRKNMFGHPHPRVLERYLSRGVEVLRTDRLGAIMVQTDGGNLSVAPFKQ